ncbi:MAG TPA: DUF2807 domain-containing protein [Caulobacteraceae bacterium]|jgi:hypothetical protein
MRAWRVGGLIAAMAAPAAWAMPRVEIRAAAAEVVIVPEARGDIVITQTRVNRRLPLRISRFGETTLIDGALGHRVRGCAMTGQGLGVRIRGMETVTPADLPALAIHTPMDVRVTVGEGVTGSVGRSASLQLQNRGCGRWTIANVRGRLDLDQIGSGEVRVGQAGEADLSVAGGGAINTRAVHGPLRAVSSGAGAIDVEGVSGPVMVRIAGSGSVGVHGGLASQLNVSIAGSGVARFGGEARSLVASVAGPGYVSVKRVSGPVSRRLFGAGEIHVGR